jgi:type II secretory pathway component PulF
LVTFSLVQFVRDWWPILVLLWGLIFILVSLGTNNSTDIQR